MDKKIGGVPLRKLNAMRHEIIRSRNRIELLTKENVRLKRKRGGE